MLVRRLVLVLTLSAVAGLGAACGSDDAGGRSSAPAAGGATAAAGSQGSSAGAGGGSSAAAGGNASGGTSGGGAGGASTEQVCAKVVAALDAEKTNLATVIVELTTANMQGDQAAKNKAKADADALVGRLTKAVNAETAKAADPKARAALDGFVAAVAKLLTVESVTDPDFENKLDAAGEEASKYCPAIKEG
ncbi:hypothetical protein [Dactylosporangium sp. CA-139066]|uniref:hypothetical protein n=1 Tax=Dactylosporangium sp. CA-139066 TaxID=3239930 RepID=UPI003D8B01D6